jgi:hypothetical protein
VRNVDEVIRYQDYTKQRFFKHAGPDVDVSNKDNAIAKSLRRSLLDDVFRHSSTVETGANDKAYAK